MTNMGKNIKRLLKIVLISLVVTFFIPPNAYAISSGEQSLRTKYSSALSSYNSSSARLRSIMTKYPAWTISGQLGNDRNSKYVYVWGTAVSSTASRSHPAWTLESGNIKVVGYSSGSIYYNSFQGTYYYQGMESGYNLFGVKVPVKRFGPAPKQVAAAQKDLAAKSSALSKSRSALVNYVVSTNQKRIKSSPNNSSYYKTYGDELSGLASFLNNSSYARTAITQYNNAIKYDSKNISAYIAKAVLADRYFNDTETVIDSYSKAAKVSAGTVDKYAKDSRRRYYIGYAFYRNGDYDRSIKYLGLVNNDSAYREYYGLDIALADSYLQKSNILEKQNNIDEAVKNLDKGAAILPIITSYSEYKDQCLNMKAQMKVKAAEMFLKKQNYKGAYDEYNEVLEYAKNYDSYSYGSDFSNYVEKAKLGIGLYYSSINDNKKAQEYINDAITNGNGEEILQYVKDSMSLNAQQYYLIGYCGSNYTMSSEKGAGLVTDFFKKAAEIEPSNKIYNNAAGYSILRMINNWYYSEDDNAQKYEDAKGYLTKAINIDPSYARAYGNMYNLLEDLRIANNDYNNDELNQLMKDCNEKAFVNNDFMAGLDPIQ